MDTLQITDLAFFGYHGVLPEENKLGQTYRVSLELEFDARPAALTDTLNKTIDYRQAITIVREIVAGPPCKLIETVADRISHRLLEELPLITAVIVVLTKPHPPVGMEVKDVTIKIRRERTHD